MSGAAVALSPFASRDQMSSSAVIFGSTGAVGRQILSSLLSESHFSAVTEIGRRQTSYPVKGVQTPSAEHLKKLRSITAANQAFEDPAALSQLLPDQRDWSTVYIALGTTRAAAGSFEAFEKIDKQYVINAALAAKLSIPQKLVYCSSGGADPRSMFPYMRSKGETERELASLGYGEVIIFRPGFLRIPDGRDEPRLVENIAGFFMKNIVSHFSKDAETPTDLLGKAMMRAGELGVELCQNSGIGKLEKLGKDGQEALVIYTTDTIKLARLESGI